ncbi:hypothetical protein RIF29_03992 [Crotalaria pallida]|uniref:Uncharacterized protein n=1 Tax=Crotalaria pallida TaxID=3830 RepID=A0AAN9P9T2_CROPI
MQGASELSPTEHWATIARDIGQDGVVVPPYEVEVVALEQVEEEDPLPAEPLVVVPMEDESDKEEALSSLEQLAIDLLDNKDLAAED